MCVCVVEATRAARGVPAPTTGTQGTLRASWSLAPAANRPSIADSRVATGTTAAMRRNTSVSKSSPLATASGPADAAGATATFFPLGLGLGVVELGGALAASARRASTAARTTAA